MPDKVIYYAVMNDLSTRDRPAGLFRRTYTEAGGLRDEAFTRNLVWKTVHRWLPLSAAICKTTSSRSPRTRPTS